MGIALHGGKSLARPGVLTFLGWVSLAWSALSLFGTAFAIVAFAVVGVAGWIGGPGPGVLTSVVGILGVLWLAASSILTLILARAGWLTLRDRPGGIPLHRAWAWITLGLEVVGLLMGGARSGHIWAGLAYAIFILWATRTPEVLGYQAWLSGRLGFAAGKPWVVDDEAF